MGGCALVKLCECACVRASACAYVCSVVNGDKLILGMTSYKTIVPSSYSLQNSYPYLFRKMLSTYLFCGTLYYFAL